MIPPDENLDWPIAYEAVLEIARSEGCKLKAYHCPAGKPTIGWGHTRGVKMGDTCTQEQADTWMLEDVTEFTNGVRGALKRDASDNELGALVSFAFNVGMGTADGKVKGFLTSTVLKKHNEGDRQSAARAFGLWNKARINGVLQVVDGLTSRRAREAAMYLSDDMQPMPQVVEPESSLKNSPIATASVTSILAGLSAGMAAWTEQGQQISATLGVDPFVGFAIVVVWTGATSLYQRIKQRREGWA